MEHPDSLDEYNTALSMKLGKGECHHLTNKMLDHLFIVRLELAEDYPASLKKAISERVIVLNSEKNANPTTNDIL